jgi:hypothetical protein
MFTAISTVLITFSVNLLTDGFDILIIGDPSFMPCGTNPLNAEITYNPFIKQDSSYNSKVSIFSSFIDLFNKSSSMFKYFPSYFQSSSSNLFRNQSVLEINNVTLIEIISYNQYLILEHHNNSLNNLLNDLYIIIMEYKQNNSV